MATNIPTIVFEDLSEHVAKARGAKKVDEVSGDKIEFWKGKYFAQKSANTELHKGIRRLKAVEKRLNEDLVSLSEEANRVIEDIEHKEHAWQIICRLFYGGTKFESWGHVADEWNRQYKALRPDYQQEGEDQSEVYDGVEGDDGQ